MLVDVRPPAIGNGGIDFLGTKARFLVLPNIRTCAPGQSSCQSKIFRLIQRLATDERALTTVPPSLLARFSTFVARVSC
jgi:hypothetical protein